MLLADRLQGEFDGSHGVPGFVGHLGGDDFFAAVADVAPDALIAAVRRVLARFAADVVSFYTPEDRARGFIEGKDRKGRDGRFDLLTCSAAIVTVPVGIPLSGPETLALAVATLKKAAKAAPDGVASSDWTSLFGPRKVDPGLADPIAPAVPPSRGPSEESERSIG